MLCFEGDEWPVSIRQSLHYFLFCISEIVHTKNKMLWKYKRRSSIWTICYRMRRSAREGKNIPHAGNKRRIPKARARQVHMRTSKPSRVARTEGMGGHLQWRMCACLVEDPLKPRWGVQTSPIGNREPKKCWGKGTLWPYHSRDAYGKLNGRGRNWRQWNQLETT